MAECALAIAADCAMSLFTVAICARRTASCVRSRWSRIIDSLLLPLNRRQLCYKIVRARAGWLRLSYERRDSASPGVSRGKYFFLTPSRNLGCQAVITMALLFSRPPKEVEEGQHAENYGCGSCDRCLRRISAISLRRYRNCVAAISRTGEFLPRR